ncbi:hypothetical protein BH23THE1_BH23THE1_27290 [soil metagenome]
MNNSNQSITERWALGDYKSIGKVISPVSAKLIRLVNIKPVDSVLDVACGFGNTAITSRRAGAKVTGIDITHELLTQAKEEESISKVSGIEWREGNAESLPFADELFDIVLSTFGHMFALNQRQLQMRCKGFSRKVDASGLLHGLQSLLGEECMQRSQSMYPLFKTTNHHHHHHHRQLLCLLDSGESQASSRNYCMTLRIYFLKGIPLNILFLVQTTIGRR